MLSKNQEILMKNSIAISEEPHPWQTLARRMAWMHLRRTDGKLVLSLGKPALTLGFPPKRFNPMLCLVAASVKTISNEVCVYTFCHKPIRKIDLPAGLIDADGIVKLSVKADRVTLSATGRFWSSSYPRPDFWALGVHSAPIRLVWHFQAVEI